MRTNSEQQRRILVVDDDVSLTRLLKVNLEQTNRYLVHVENRAAQAVATAEEFQPDLILLDVMMPEPDGGELAERFRARPKLKDIPIVFLTAAVKKEEVSSHDGRIGGLPFIAKPVALAELVSRIEENLRGSPARI